MEIALKTDQYLTHRGDVGSPITLGASVLQCMTSASQWHSAQTKLCFYHSILALSTLFNHTRLPYSPAIIEHRRPSRLSVFTHTPILFHSGFSSVSPHFHLLLQLSGHPRLS